ncbi:MmcB family DNA repair protein [Bacillus cereus]|uniref:MmcB family DNA repair protein n=1 Tax=Bacillus cereus TaxID=1396 RepID=UPI00227F91A2|nr:MmcB family DNA repair protein [Bacillus cereus]
MAAFNDENEIIFVEVKASDRDFQIDKKWKEYIPFCDKFYFFGDWFSLPDCIDDKVDAGFLRKQKNTIEVYCETAMEHSVANRDAIIFLFHVLYQRDQYMGIKSALSLFPLFGG